MVSFYPHFISCGEKSTLEDVAGEREMSAIRECRFDFLIVNGFARKVRYRGTPIAEIHVSPHTRRPKRILHTVGSFARPRDMLIKFREIQSAERVSCALQARYLFAEMRHHSRIFEII